MNNPAPRVGTDAAPIITAPSGFPAGEEVDVLWRIGLFSPDDERALRKLWRLLKGQTDDYLDMVLGMVAAYPELAGALATVCREGLGESMDGSATVRRRFRQWLSETCLTPRAPSWLERVYARYADVPPERLAPTLSAEWPGFRYLVALSFPLVAAARALLVGGGAAAQDIEPMQSALRKALLLQVTLLSKLYVRKGLW